jgi:hypothetical protein
MRSLMAIIFAVMISSGALVSVAVSQDLVPLEQVLKRPKDQLEPSYPFVRCAAYYKSLLDYIGAKNLSTETVANSHQAATLNGFAAAKLRASKRGGSPTDYVDQVMSDVGRIVSVYDARMRNNYAVSGQAFGGDPVITADGATCKALTEGLAGR